MTRGPLQPVGSAYSTKVPRHATGFASGGCERRTGASGKRGTSPSGRSGGSSDGSSSHFPWRPMHCPSKNRTYRSRPTRCRRHPMNSRRHPTHFRSHPMDSRCHPMHCRSDFPGCVSRNWKKVSRNGTGWCRSRCERPASQREAVYLALADKTPTLPGIQPAADLLSQPGPPCAGRRECPAKGRRWRRFFKRPANAFASFAPSRDTAGSVPSARRHADRCLRLDRFSVRSM